ncbi:hypothetical protein UK23_05830 [Lentzea aerocolonigenes]|uniref:Uncharacterized protein n=1 Tax=Lentzea aerocolonigenes TaxID=68170 RepID=A0A0F0H821_LENAE|nr:hypothetical protein [Lentzea aerocolonigenes]KJK51650.1 hypothetical protein UK23_05830 [Lentzea aerocolonigenes]
MIDPRKLVKRLPVADTLLDRRAYAGAGGDRRAALLNALVPLESLGSSLTFAVTPAHPAVLSWPVRLPPLTALLAPGTPLTGAQVVVHTEPSAANRWTWISVSSPDLATASGWTRDVLAQHGFTAVQLDRDGVLDAVALIAGLDGGTASTKLIERGFDSCTMGSGVHACFTWSSAPVLEALTQLPSVRATVGVRLARAGGEFVAERVLKLSAPDPKSLLSAGTWLAQVPLTRLNGHHASAAATTVPVCVPPVWPSQRAWTHIEPAAVAGQSAAWTGSAGIVLGWDVVRQTHAPLRLFQERPVTGVVSSPRLAHLIAARAVSCGAAVTVQGPHPWRGPFGHAAPGPPALASGTPRQPHLLVVDRPSALPSFEGISGSHHAVLVVADPLGPEHVPLLDVADLVVVGELSTPQQALLRGVFSGWLDELSPVPGEVTVLSHGVAARVGITLTGPEQHLLS